MPYLEHVRRFLGLKKDYDQVLTSANAMVKSVSSAKAKAGGKPKARKPKAKAAA